MVLEVKKYPDPILRKKCRKVEDINKETKNLIRDMLETMYANNGVGLSACQVGVLKNISVVDVGSGPMVFVNPKILQRQGKEISKEGCLSIPGVFLNINRAKEIEVEAVNQNREKFKIQAKGLLSYCLQHEIDHLNGILILDRIGLLKGMALKKKLSKNLKIHKQ
ncbi:MAG: peptide deformylase [Patescibacteria group bacterium]|nr:peptide deformylase [Patescibacteria group bacterium]